MSLGWEASSLRASIRAVLLQKMSCLYEGGGARREERIWCAVGVRRGAEDSWRKLGIKRDADAGLKEKDKVLGQRGKINLCIAKVLCYFPRQRILFTPENQNS